MSTWKSPQLKVIVPPGKVAPGYNCAIAASKAASVQLAPVPLPTTASSARAADRFINAANASTDEVRMGFKTANPA